MKKLLLIIIGFVVIWGAFHFFKSTPSTSPNEGKTSTETPAGKPDPSNGTFLIDGSEVALTNGVSRVENEAGLTTETLLIKNKFAYGDLNTDGAEDVALLLEQSGGGSGTFIYLAAYISGPLNRKGSNAVFIGDRVAPQTLSLKNGVITLTYLDRNADEPFAATPTVSVTKQFVYKNGELVEK